MSSDLREEIIRYVQLTNRRATPHAVVEGMRNRWDDQLDPLVEADKDPRTGRPRKVKQSKLFGIPAYAEQVTTTLQQMLDEGELDMNQSTFTRQRTRHEKPTGWISFAWTTAALVEGHKTVTRREWTDRYATRFKQGDLLHAYDRRPAWGGKPVALIRLTQTPYKQSSSHLSPLDWDAEGFAWLQSMGKKVGKETPREVWQRWQDEPQDFWVVRFEIVELL
mgnify:CR=1 FL=1